MLIKVLGFLPQIFNLKPTFKYNSSISTRSGGLKKQQLLQNRPLFKLLDVHEKKIEVEKRTTLWFSELEKVYQEVTMQLNTNAHNNQFTLNFVFCMRNFWNRLIAETDYINKPKSTKRKIGTLAQLGTENELGINKRKRNLYRKLR
ncbi:13245_t:CDS:2 [Entrophospora sp. SA101]|nr:13245_t:CDS:2 [Entrophospora sp. SA101]